ncbi:HdeD family acid-resistance protein [Gordonia jinhuaensis]|uniref:Membrane protein n=1 Tax=Gordonia jinhuaensis TaxID=1517702 RepID=A0A916WZL6_9ACTN|nr:DUF308 domain-containing protein [Gordonia jinhuaensis]GGB45788.1 membrane protein [Gordonia jinhuaensis]
MTEPSKLASLPDELVNSVRSAMIFTSVVGIIIGIIALVWPRGTLVVVAVLFGIALIITGLFRLYIAFAAPSVPGGFRVLYALLGFAILLLGIIALFHPGSSLWILGIFIGVSWIFDGIQSLFELDALSALTPKWFVVLSAVISILAGIVMLTLPTLAVATFLWVGAILLIVVSVINLFRLPKKRATV